MCIEFIYEKDSLKNNNEFTGYLVIRERRVIPRLKKFEKKE